MTEDQDESPNETQADTEPRDQTQPFLRIIRGNPTAEETAAVVTVLAALSSASTDPTPRRTSEWSAHHRQQRRSLPHGPGGWRSSGLPR